MQEIKKILEYIHIQYPYDDHSSIYHFFTSSNNTYYIENELIPNFNNTFYDKTNINTLINILNYQLKYNYNLYPVIPFENINTITDIINIISSSQDYKNNFYIYKEHNDHISYFNYAYLLSFIFLYKKDIPNYENIFKQNQEDLRYIYKDLYDKNDNFNDLSLLPYDDTSFKIDIKNQILIDKNDNRLSLSVPCEILEYLLELQTSGFQFDLSFKITDINPLSKIYKHMHYGKKLDISLQKLPNLSLFSDFDSKNKIFIKHDIGKKQLTFEELQDDYLCFNDDYLTQVVHLIYEYKNGIFYINHIDHEYILYNEEQYELKLSNLKIKGYKRYKTFKIDKANIPFFHKNIKNQYFLYMVLFSSFYNKDIVQEYFENIIN